MNPSRPTKRPRKRRQFSPEFKAEAVRLATSSDKSISAVARELDITVSCLHDWADQARVDEARDPRGALTTDERAELVRLRRELRAAEEERDFLKKRRRTSRRASREVRRHRRPRGHARGLPDVPSTRGRPVRLLCLEEASVVGERAL